nr:DNA repair helicase component of transcription factor b [Cryptomonas curvata]
MIIFIESLKIRFPMNIIYPEQIQIMYILKKSLDSKAHCIMGIPSGVGLSSAAFCFFLSYEKFMKISKKIIYWTSSEIDTHFMIEQWTLLYKKLMINNDKNDEIHDINVSGIFDKKKLCIDYRSSDRLKIQEIEDLCQSLTLCRLEKKNKRKNIFKSLIKKKIICQFFSNFLEKSKNYKLKGILSLNKVLKEGIYKKICPFYLSRHFLIESNIIIGDIKYFILNDNFDLIPQKQIRCGVLILDNLYEIDGINTEFCCFQLSKIITENSERGILIVKKETIRKDLKRKINKKIYYSNLKKNFALKNKNALFKQNNFIDCNLYFFIKYFRLEKKNTRILNLVKNVQELTSRMKEILQFKGIWRWSLTKFLKYLIKNSYNIEFSIDCFRHIPKQIFKVIQSTGIFQNRRYNGMIKIGKFFKIISSCEESLNENFQFFFISLKQKYDILSESVINLICKESSILIKLILEKFKSVIFFTNIVLNLKIFILLIDCKPLLYGILKNFTLKCNIIPILINHKLIKSKNTRFSTDLEEHVFNIYFLFINQALDIVPEGALIFFPRFYPLEIFVEKWKNNKVLKKILKNRKIFIETSDFKLNLTLLEDFKLSIDLGNNSLFIGFYGGILYQANLNLNYTKTIFAIDSPFIINNYLSNFIKEKIWLNRQSKRNENWNHFISHKESGHILNKFFKSKKEYGVFIKISKSYKLKNTFSFSPEWEIFNIYEKECKINPVLVKIKELFKLIN